MAASRLPKFRRSPKIVDSVLSFFEENSFTTPQMEKIILFNPRILGFSIESLKFRFKVFRDLGLSSVEVAKTISSNPSILNVSVANKIIPSLSVLRGVLGSNQNVVRLLRKSVWFINRDLDETLIPNIEILKSYGLTMERILHFLHVCPRVLLVKPDIMKKSVDRAIDIGISRASGVFINAVAVLSYTREGMWEVKLETLSGLGFSDNDICEIFRKQPLALSISQKKMKNLTELLFATGKYNISSIVGAPAAFGCSIEKRLEPRLQILGLLERKNLIKKWPSLGSAISLTDDEFFDKFIRPYYDEIGEEDIIQIHARGRKR